MNRNDNPAETLSPTEYAELVRDAHEVIAAVERAISRTAATFALFLGLTITTTALHLPVAPTLAAVIAVVAFGAAVILVMIRIYLGPVPEVAPTAPSPVLPAPGIGSAAPATGSGPATTENGGVSTK